MTGTQLSFVYLSESSESLQEAPTLWNLEPLIAGGRIWHYDVGENMVYVVVVNGSNVRLLAIPADMSRGSVPALPSTDNITSLEWPANICGQSPESSAPLVHATIDRSFYFLCVAKSTDSPETQTQLLAFDGKQLHNTPLAISTPKYANRGTGTILRAGTSGPILLFQHHPIDYRSQPLAGFSLQPNTLGASLGKISVNVVDLKPDIRGTSTSESVMVIVLLTVSFLTALTLAGWYDYTRWKAPIPPKPNRTIDAEDNTDDKTLNEGGTPTQKQPEKDEDEFDVRGKLSDERETGEDKLTADQDDAISIVTETPPSRTRVQLGGDEQRIQEADRVPMKPYSLQIMVLRAESPSVGSSQNSGESDATMGGEEEEPEEWVPKPFDPHAFAHVHAPPWTDGRTSAARPSLAAAEPESAPRLACADPA
ncbi:hypothetical protein BGZ73_006697 [Actinomortierella ambigua]|nr:hypothetical protein BGZ73_006697 [Actinomortierella ambigua]